MAETAAWVIDSEALDKALERVWGGRRRYDLFVLRDYLEGVRPGRTLLWTTWVTLERASETDDQRRRRDGYHCVLRANQVRVEIAQPKPINRFHGRAEANLCDFLVIEAIERAARKCDTVIVAGGDGHLRRAIDRARIESGCRVEMVCDREGLSGAIQADYVHYLENVVQAINLERRDPPSCAG